MFGLVFLILLSFPVAPVGAYEFVICKDCKHTTIQPAIDAAWPGATVVVGKGIYEENLTVDIPLTLRGKGKAKTKIKSAEKGKPVLTVGSAEGKVNLEGITFMGARAERGANEDRSKGSGMFVHGEDNRVYVSNSSFEDNDGWGIYLKGSNKLVADKIKASSNKQGGVFIKDDSVVTVSDSYFVNNEGNGIFAKGGKILNLNSNRIAGNARGVYFYYSPTITLKNNLIKNNGSGILTYGDLFRGEIKGSGNVVQGSISPPLESGEELGFWPEDFTSTVLTFTTSSETFPHEDLTLPEGLEFEYVKYEKLLGIERQIVIPDGPEIALVWGKGEVDYIPDPVYNSVTYRPYALNERGHLSCIDGEISNKSHLFSIYLNDGYGWKPGFFIPAGAASRTHEEVVDVDVRDLIYSSSGKELMVIFWPSSPTNPIKRFLLKWTGDRLKVFHKSNYDRYQGSERYDFNTYIRQRPVSTCFEGSLHPNPSSFCYKQFRLWDGDEYEILREELSWRGFDFDADISGNCMKALNELTKDFQSGLIGYRSDPLKLARHLKGGNDAKYWQVFKQNGLAIIYRIEGRKKERLFAYQPFYHKEGNGEKIWALTSENFYEKGRAMK